MLYESGFLIRGTSQVYRLLFGKVTFIFYLYPTTSGDSNPFRIFLDIFGRFLIFFSFFNEYAELEAQCEAIDTNTIRGIHLKCLNLIILSLLLKLYFHDFYIKL